jgi:hypothetical protein
LANYIGAGEFLTKGRWLLVLYHSGCAECESLIAQWVRAHALLEGRGRVAFVSVPPHVKDDVVREMPGVLWGGLSQDNEWLVRTPVVLTVEDGWVLGSYANVEDGVVALRGRDGRGGPSETGRTGFEASPEKNRSGARCPVIGVTGAHSTEARDCGPACLYVISAVSNRPRTLEWCRDALEMSPRGVSLLAIKRECERLGFAVTACKGPYGVLSEHVHARRGMAVLHLSSDHFVVAVRGLTRDRVCIVDPAAGMRNVRAEELLKSCGWSGNMLLLVLGGKG